MISVSDIYDKDLNFLIGSGASSGLLPTLKLGLLNAHGTAWSIEELATHFENDGDARLIPLFMHYYATCIRPAQALTLSSVSDATGKSVLLNYRRFLDTVVTLVSRRKALDRRCNLFTTNYDGCIPLVADEIIEAGTHDFVLNDGTRGFRRKSLEARNFSSFLCRTGIFDRHQSSIPQINFIQLHGSVYWRKAVDGIFVDYTNIEPDLLDPATRSSLLPFSTALLNPASTLPTIPDPIFSSGTRENFWTKYKAMPVVNPTKWKFYETVYEEHYYQMLRLLSYELEKPNAVLITFGFSFADEHILNLVKRSLSNPHLQVFVCCFDVTTQAKLQSVFGQFKNVKCLVPEDGSPLDFTYFNSHVLALDSAPPSTTSSAATPGTTP